MRRFIALALGLVCLGGPAIASSNDSWEALRASVRAKCLASASGDMKRIKISVDPFGSESYGLALVTGYESGATAPSRRICIVGKRSGKAELGNDLPR